MGFGFGFGFAASVSLCSSFGESAISTPFTTTSSSGFCLLYAPTLRHSAVSPSIRTHLTDLPDCVSAIDHPPPVPTRRSRRQL
ncbi:hypothetical protein BGZ61DRAFT_199547 [Ilyonectria robusta]|uniref:uncharacterized protein n=1 Tax=Ilyonectria robusta TaxID=1079257 RepID=UPI001E8DE046|nr:uncharacterized protein BGZ61DRAFT_199547 [Ilyonectria robusta]KAH8722085.1 hypothetical protein BGZ61DRAFT_199547 [Ilyonectria robusta]